MRTRQVNRTLYAVSEILRIDGYHLPIISEFTLHRARLDEQDWFIASPIYFALGILVTLTLFQPSGSFIGIIALAITDTFSTLVRVEFGKHKISYNTNKSWEGFLGGCVTLIMFLILPLGLLRAIIISICAGIIETSPGPVSDNLPLPIGTAFIMNFIIFQSIFL